MHRSISFITALLVTSSLALAGATIVKSYISNDNGQIVLVWTSGEEVNVDGYLIERAMNESNQYVPIMTNKIAATGSGSTYEYKDLSAQKMETTTYRYRLVIVNKDQSRDVSYFLGSVSAGSPISAVKRTWGSIKALFR